MTTKPMPHYGSAFQSKSGPQQPLVRTSTTVSPKNQIQNGYAQYGHTQHGQTHQGHTQPSNNRTPGAAAWTQPLVQAQNSYFTACILLFINLTCVLNLKDTVICIFKSCFIHNIKYPFH